MLGDLPEHVGIVRRHRRLHFSLGNQANLRRGNTPSLHSRLTDDHHTAGMSTHTSAPVTRWLRRLTLLVMLALGAWWLWQSDIGQQLRLTWWLQRQPAPTSLPVPVDGVAARRIADTWGGTRSGGRHHQGVDIFAKRGTKVRSNTPGLVVRVADFGIGGKHVWVLGPAGERHYYAHLDDWAPGLARGTRVDVGTPLGSVGNTGNAKGTPPHLHYGIYTLRGAYNPWPLLQAGADTHAAHTQPNRR